VNNPTHIPNFNKNHRYITRSNKNRIHKDVKAVSEAIGTILLLAIAIVLAGAVAVWAHSLDMPEVGRNVDLSSSVDQNVVVIHHMGGEILDEEDTLITIVIDGVAYYHYNFEDSENTDLDDGLWEMGDKWTKDMSVEISSYTDPKIEVYVRDTKTDEILLVDTIKEGSILDYPDLAVSADDIEFEFQDEVPIIGRWINITATVWNVGNIPAKNAIIRFFDDDVVLKRGTQTYQVLNISNSPGNNYASTWVNFTTGYWGKRTITIKVYTSLTELNYRNNYASTDLYVEPILPSLHGPDLEVSNYDILLSNSNPVHGDKLQITVVVHNAGDRDIPAGTMINVNIHDDKGFLDRNYKFSIGLTSGLNHPCNFGIWEASPGGISIITVEVDTEDAVLETEEQNNNASRALQIMQTILVVDDDDTTTGEFDVFEELTTNLDASAVNYKWVKSEDENGLPDYSIGQYPLKNFDIIIWLTGYETSNTLTANNIDDLKSSLNNGTSLWLIGQDILMDLTTKFGDKDGLSEPGEFTYDYLGVEDYNKMGTNMLLEGIDGDPITNGLNLNTSDIVESEDRGILLKPRTPGTSDEIAGILKNDTTILGKGWNTSLRYYNATHGFKVVFFAWEFAGVNNIIDRVNTTYHVLKWLNWSISVGKDFAVSSEEFSSESPKFMDKLTIKATIRNNGPLPGDNVRVMFYVTGPNGDEDPIPNHPDSKDNPQIVYVPGDGGEITVSKDWLAVSVGQHNFRVMVDPYNEVEEVSEENNDVEYSNLFVTELFIRYNILVVDDDNSTNNALSGNGANVTQNMTNALDFLGYDYDLYVVPGGFTPEQGPNVTFMKFYNTVIWLTGNTSIDTLKQADQENLTAYLQGDYYEAQFLGETRVNFWLISQDLLDDLETPGKLMTPKNPFVTDILHITNYSTDAGLPSEIEGLKYDPITHGLDYPINANAFNDTSDLIVPDESEGAAGIFYQDSGQTKYNALRYNGSKYNLIFFPWDFSFVDNPSDYGGGGQYAYDVWDTPGLETNQAELVYLAFHWLKYPETRIELRTCQIDIELSDENPMLGNSYIFHTDVYNLGLNETSAIIRFFDGDTLMATNSLYIPADSNSTVEVIWIPLFAGARTITILVDYEDAVSEIFDNLNNQATSENLKVYFFHDDLEDGANNWYHDSTIININGESPLDFLTAPVYTNIEDTFEISSGFEMNKTEYHSYNASFHASEPFNKSARSVSQPRAGVQTKYIETNSFSLVNISSAILSFYHKYDIKLEQNGVLVRIGTFNQSSGNWEFKYMMPLQVYNSNLDFNYTIYDDYGQEMRWCWNGVSDSGTFDWEFAEFDLGAFIGEPMVKINFTFYIISPRISAGGNFGWWLDDIVVKVTRNNEDPITSDAADQWELTSTDAHSGSYCWWNHNATSSKFSGGIDNSLYTRPIDLTNANDATLSAYFKFNINKTTSQPPDGFRVEISDDNGLTWHQLNIGIRTSWGVSGNESDLEDGMADGKSYTGLDVYGDDTVQDYWIEANTLTRLKCNLTSWRGSIVMLRFRMVTASDDNPDFGGNHIENSAVGFGGLYIDDILIVGSSLLN
jgi:FlaG/FlaF family flagellin (archaellin)